MKAVVDRIEGAAAVLLLGDEEIKLDIPLKLLPQGTREGSLLQVDFKLDREAEDKQRERIAGKLERLKNKGKEEA